MGEKMKKETQLAAVIISSPFFTFTLTHNLKSLQFTCQKTFLLTKERRVTYSTVLL